MFTIDGHVVLYFCICLILVVVFVLAISIILFIKHPWDEPVMWIKIEDQLPPLDKVVHTRINDENGIRNESELKRCQNSTGTRNLYYLPDGSMYVYYKPTEWRHK